MSSVRKACCGLGGGAGEWGWHLRGGRGGFCLGGGSPGGIPQSGILSNKREPDLGEDDSAQSEHHTGGQRREKRLGMVKEQAGGPRGSSGRWECMW